MAQPRSRQDIELFQKEVQAFPVGTRVVANSTLHLNLARAKGRRDRDKEMTGVVVGFNEQQLRIIVEWDHPDWKDREDKCGCTEHLAGRYLEVAP